MGLATVYGIMKQNNGFVSLYSEVGEGSTVKLYFPRYLGDAVEGLDVTCREEPAGGDETVLLVEEMQRFST